ncbi:MAG: hypothetical protein IT577_08435 [Verrucomicrobiae bacterium]|nr:hypothetical protein [Verrucomicrobiae bacterium]
MRKSWKISVWLAIALMAPSAVMAEDQAGESPPWSAARITQALDQLLRDAVSHDALQRPDGCVYAIDLTGMMLLAVETADQDLYRRLEEKAVTHLLVHDPSDPLTDGMVAWRYRPGESLDASGTTEALRLAEALWRADALFNRPTDRDLAVLILHAYARHAVVDQDIWLIRNYFNLQTRAFATNSYLVDYDPDLLAKVAKDTGDAMLADMAERSASLVRKAIAPCGLLHEIVQPEVLTLMPTLPGAGGSVAFSPNDIIHLGNSATVARGVAKSAPEIGRGVLAFAIARLPDLRVHYLGRTGEKASADDDWAGGDVLAALVLLADELGDRSAVERLRPFLLGKAQNFAEHPGEPRVYQTTFLLRAMDAVSRAAPPAKD